MRKLFLKMRKQKVCTRQNFYSFDMKLKLTMKRIYNEMYANLIMYEFKEAR